MKKISLAILLCHCLITVTAQQQYSKAVNEKIAQVETNLSGGLVIDGKLYSIAERMKHYNVAGLSVAVIDNCDRGKELKSSPVFISLVSSLPKAFNFFSCVLCISRLFQVKFH